MATCRTCYAATLSGDELQRFLHEPVTSTIYLCPDHQMAEDSLWSRLIERYGPMFDLGRPQD